MPRRRVEKDWKHYEYRFPDGRSLSFKDLAKLAAFYQETEEQVLKRFEAHKLGDRNWKPEEVI